MKTDEAVKFLNKSRDFLSELDKTLETSRQIQTKQRFENLLPDLNPEIAKNWVSDGTLPLFLGATNHIHTEECLGEDGVLRKCTIEKCVDGFKPFFSLRTSNDIDALAYQYVYLGDVQVRTCYDNSYKISVLINKKFRYDSKRQNYFNERVAFYQKELDTDE